MNRCTRLSTGLLLFAACGAAHAGVTFGIGPTLATPQRPAGVVIADFNGDTHNDVAVATDSIDKITVYFGNGAGAFTGPVNSPTGAGTGPDTMAALDWDGDGDTDLAVVLKNINTLRIFLNNGSGFFTGGAAAPVGGDARSLVAVDLNADGARDFLTANRAGNTVSIILRNGATLISSSLPTGAEPRGVAVGYIDTGNTWDLAVSCHDDRTVRTYLGNGDGTFTPAQTLTMTNVRPDGIILRDLNHDDLDDIASAVSNAPDAIRVWINSAGSFGAFQDFLTGGLNPSHVIAADFDADGHLDVAVTNSDTANVSVMPGTGTGAFGASTLLTGGTTPDIVAAGDFNHDTMPDIAFSNRDSNTTSIYLNLVSPPRTCDPDVNCDGSADGYDVEAMERAVGGDFTHFCQSNRDFNGDGSVDGFDVESVEQVVGGAPCP